MDQQRQISVPLLLAGANCMALSLAHGRRVTLSKVDAFADGVAVKSVSLLPKTATKT